MFFIQASTPDDSEKQLNLILLVVYYLIKRRLKHVFSEKQKFLCNTRFAAVFAKTSLNPVIKNRNSLKELISKQK